MSGELRPALPRDADQIVALTRAGTSPRILPYTIFGASGVAAFVRERIEQGEQVLVAARGDEIDGFAEFRHVDGALFLNHVYVRPDRRGSGAGRRLVHAGIERFRVAGEEALALDVFADNLRALHWYLALGMGRVSSAEWRVAPLPAPGAVAGWRLVGLPEADATHARFGFSELQLVADAGPRYVVGRLGADALRTREAALLGDAPAVGALTALQPRRRILCIAPREDFTPRALAESVRVAESLRLRGPLDLALEGTAPGPAGGERDEFPAVDRSGDLAPDASSPSRS